MLSNISILVPELEWDSEIRLFKAFEVGLLGFRISFHCESSFEDSFS